MALSGNIWKWRVCSWRLGPTRARRTSMALSGNIWEHAGARVSPSRRRWTCDCPPLTHSLFEEWPAVDAGR
eukprot:4771763-Heterocapsa_arctica.AAC.1